MKQIFLKIRLFLLSALGHAKNKGDEDKNIGTIEVKIQFSKPQAIVFKKNLLKTQELTNKTTLFQIDEKGNVSPVIEGITVTHIQPFSYGAYIEINDTESYIIFFDNSYIQLPVDYNYKYPAPFIGENEEGDLIFRDVSMIKKGSTEFITMQTTLSNPVAVSLSGNFLTIVNADFSIRQIYNTVGGEGYTISEYRIVALDKNTALLSDSRELIDMRNGNRTKLEISSCLTAIYTGNGAIMLLSSYHEPPCMSYKNTLGFLDNVGKFTMLSHDFNLVMWSSAALFITDNYYIVKELNQISVVRKGESTKKSILDKYNVISMSVTGDRVFFIAEDLFDNKTMGYYSLTTKETIWIITHEEFDEVFAL
ncbi:MAG: hypothetical protein LBR55_07475 [Bacteroidales bacterium]|jgi:hypothetical protein|nr:hypothetical protein [Bacteroidales bacterium]